MSGRRWTWWGGEGDSLTHLLCHSSSPPFCLWLQSWNRRERESAFNGVPESQRKRRKVSYFCYFASCDSPILTMSICLSISDSAQCPGPSLSESYSTFSVTCSHFSHSHRSSCCCCPLFPLGIIAHVESIRLSESVSYLLLFPFPLLLSILFFCCCFC